MSANQIAQIESKSIKAIAEYLYAQRIPITYFGKAWGGCKNNWIYFDTCLDINALKVLFELDDGFEVHENLDPKSGTWALRHGACSLQLGTSDPERATWEMGCRAWEGPKAGA